MKHIFAVICVALLTFASGAKAEAPFGSFENVSAMEHEIGSAIMALDFEKALSVIDPRGRSLSQEQKDRFVGSLKNYYRQPLNEMALVKEDELGAGFRRAMYAYWRDTLPLYVYLVTQERDGGIWILQYNIETTFSKIIDKF